VIAFLREEFSLQEVSDIQKRSLVMRKRCAPKAFTLIELLLVLVILAVLAAVVVPNLVKRADEARRGATITEVHNIKGMLSTFEIDNARFPTEQEGLPALLQAPPDLGQSWKGPYTDKMPRDSYGNAYRYVYPSEDGFSPFNVISAGKDGQFGTEDDIDVYTVN
jgi:general secretion pathway protein G